MNKQDNDDWFDELTNSVSRVISGSQQQLNSLLSDSPEWNEFAKFFASKNEAFDKDIESIVRAFKQYGDRRDSKLKIVEINKEHTVKHINYLLNLVSKPINSTKENQFLYETPLINKENISWLLVLIAYIYSTESEQSFDGFAKTFIKLTASLQEDAEKMTNVETAMNSPVPLLSLENNSIENHQVVQKINTATPPQSQNRTLILIFGQSQWEGVNKIKNKTEFSDSDYELLKRYEWFWYGVTKSPPAEILNDEQGNMCWLQLDMQLKNIFEIKNRLGFMDLIDKIKKQQVIVAQMKVGGLFQLATSGLSGKGFIKA